MNTTTKIVNPSTQILYEDEITIVSTQADYVNEDLANDLKNVLSGIDIIIEVCRLGFNPTETKERE